MQEEEFLHPIEKQRKKLSLLDKREYPKGAGVWTNTPANFQPPPSLTPLNPPPLIQEEEFMQTIEKQRKKQLSLLDKLIFGQIF